MREWGRGKERRAILRRGRKREKERERERERERGGRERKRDRERERESDKETYLLKLKARPRFYSNVDSFFPLFYLVRHCNDHRHYGNLPHAI